MSALLAKAWRDHRRTLIGFGLGLAFMQLLYAAFYPSIKESAADMNAFMERLPEALRELYGNDFASPEGYLRGQLFGELGLILFLVVAIGAAARATAGEEETRTLDLLLSTPVQRRQVLLDKAVAIVTVCGLLAVVTFVAVAVIGPPFDLEVPLGNLAAASTMLVLLGMSFAGIGLAIGSVTGRRVVSSAMTGGLAVVAFILNALAPSVSWLEPLRPLSPLRWYMEPDTLAEGGLAALNVAVLVGIALVGYAVAHVAFDRRDLQARRRADQPRRSASASASAIRTSTIRATSACGRGAVGGEPHRALAEVVALQIGRQGHHRVRAHQVEGAVCRGRPIADERLPPVDDHRDAVADLLARVGHERQERRAERLEHRTRVVGNPVQELLHGRRGHRRGHPFVATSHSRWEPSSNGSSSSSVARKDVKPTSSSIADSSATE